MTTQSTIDALVERLDQAALTGVATPQLSDEHALSLPEAYALQHTLVDRRVARGERRVGVKLGMTSEAKAAQMGVSDVIIGELTSGMLVPDGQMLSMDRFVHPRTEPEIALRLGQTIDPADPPDDPVATVDAVAAALEIIDSRYRDFRFNLADVIADNTSAAGAVLGPWQSLPEDVSDLAVTLTMDGRIAATGSTAAILGDPIRAVEATLRMAATYGFQLPTGTVILAGAATEALALTPDTAVEATVEGLGAARFTTGGGNHA